MWGAWRLKGGCPCLGVGLRTVNAAGQFCTVRSVRLTAAATSSANSSPGCKHSLISLLHGVVQLLQGQVCYFDGVGLGLRRNGVIPSSARSLIGITCRFEGVTVDHGKAGVSFCLLLVAQSSTAASHGLQSLGARRCNVGACQLKRHLRGCATSKTKKLARQESFLGDYFSVIARPFCVLTTFL